MLPVSLELSEEGVSCCSPGETIVEREGCVEVKLDVASIAVDFDVGTAVRRGTLDDDTLFGEALGVSVMGEGVGAATLGKL